MLYINFFSVKRTGVFVSPVYMNPQVGIRAPFQLLLSILVKRKKYVIRQARNVYIVYNRFFFFCKLFYLENQEQKYKECQMFHKMIQYRFFLMWHMNIFFIQYFHSPFTITCKVSLIEYFTTVIFFFFDFSKAIKIRTPCGSPLIQF